MDVTSVNPILKFNSNQVEEVRKLFNYHDVNKLYQDLDILEDWIRKQNHFTVREFDRGYLERYLLANKGSVERTKKRLDRLCTLRNLLPELTQNFNIKHEFDALFRCTRQCVLPKPTKDHYRVLISEVHNAEDYENAELLHFYRYAIVFIEYMLCHDHNAGIEFIMDNRRMSLGVLAKMNPLVVHKAFTLMEAYGLRLKTLHIISSSKFLDTLVSIMKQGMSTKLGSRIQIHTNVESLHRFIAADILPEDYGGHEKSIAELTVDLFKEMSSDKQVAWMKYVEGVSTDEACRLSGDFNEEYMGMPGSFKTLCVD
ncbi:clavesin-1-like [Pectinophora gossypiella]|uniref:clavesin-1-like n=1 Tax=Pectinophora gossypiella TaxID=13191 RepID=UPI00214F24AC|nr:clavesin-1-like [Pectinophora gossypiella]